MIARKTRAESGESERQRSFPPLHASSLPFPAFHLRCTVPKISRLAASFLCSHPGPPLKLCGGAERSLRWDWKRRCFLSVPVEEQHSAVFFCRSDVRPTLLLTRLRRQRTRGASPGPGVSPHTHLNQCVVCCLCVHAAAAGRDLLVFNISTKVFIFCVYQAAL